MKSLKNLSTLVLFLVLFSCNKPHNNSGTNTIKPIIGPSIIVGTSGDFFAIDEASGDVLWHDSLNAYNRGLSMRGTMFYTGSWDMAYGFDDSTGKVVWSFHAPNQIDNTLLQDNKLMVTDFNGGLFALDATSGKQLWKDSAGPFAFIYPGGNMLLGSSNDDNFYAYNVTNGNLLWKHYSGPVNQIPMSFAVGSGEVFAQTFDYKFYAVDSLNGSLKWTFNNSDSIICDPLLINNAVCTASTDGHFYALDRATGATHWTYSDGDSVYFYMAMAVNGLIYINGLNHTIYCLDAASGLLKWKYATNGYLDCTPTVYNGVIYMRNRSGKIYAVDVASGNLVWSVDLATVSNIPITVVDGNLYVGGSDLKLYNLNATTGAIITAAQKFLAEYSKELSANNLMPATFPVTFQADAVACIDLATAFAEADRIKEMAVGEKIKSNNALYLSLTGMLVDAKNIFKDDANTPKQFSVARLVAENGDKNAASLSGYVYNENNLPIEGAVIASKNGLYTATTNAKGRYTISRINSEEEMYTFAITCPGYQPITQDIDFKAGTGTRVSFTLASVMKKVA